MSGVNGIPLKKQQQQMFWAGTGNLICTKQRDYEEEQYFYLFSLYLFNLSLSYFMFLFFLFLLIYLQF